MNWATIILTLELAVFTTVILFFISIPIAFWLSETKSKLKPFVQAFVNLPLILPPTVLGFYLLISFAPNSFIGSLLNDVFGIRLAFSFSGILIGSIIYSLPFMVQPLYSGLMGLPKNLKNASFILGKSKTTTLFQVLLPSIKPSFLTAIALTFAHTIGEFGVVLMIGGNIPGETKVLSIEIYDQVESLNHDIAHLYSSFLVGISFLVLLIIYWKNRKKEALI